MTTSDTCTAYVAVNLLRGSILTQRIGGISIDNPGGVYFLLLGGTEVVLTTMVSYPIEPGVALSGSKSTSFVAIGDFFFPHIFYVFVTGVFFGLLCSLVIGIL